MPSPTRSADEIWPWPWGSECPFNWNDFEGHWMRNDGVAIEHFKFKVIEEDIDGTRYLEVTHVGQENRLLGHGTAYAPRGGKIARGPLYVSGEGEKSDRYWVIIRFYKKAPAKSCRPENEVLAVTLRKNLYDEEGEQSFTIEKVPPAE